MSSVDAASAENGAQSVSDRELTYERVFHAPRERVFEAWTKPEVLSRWWGPGDATAPEVSLDLREGGEWMTVIRFPSGSEHHIAGVYREIDPPSRLVFTWGWINDGKRGHETLVTIEFEDQGEATLMRFHQGTFLEPEHAKNHNEGWQGIWTSLDRFLAEN